MHDASIAAPYRETRSLAEIPSYGIAVVMCSMTVLAYLILSEDCRHWFVLPVLLCGIIVGVDAVEWARGRMDVFDPVGLLGTFGLHFFFMSPLMQVSNDFWVSSWLPITSALPDWRPWVGMMAILNACGLIAYQFVMRTVSRRPAQRVAHRQYRLDHNSFPIILAAAAALAACLQLWIYYRFGGVVGYVTAVEELKSEAFAGWGRICLISESLPLLLVMGFAIYGRRNPLARSWVVLAVLGIAFLLLTLLCSGLRGCRSNTIWTLFWAVGLIHFWVRPISKKVVCAGLIFLMLFMYGYGFYKWGGRAGVASMMDSSARAEWVNETNRSAMRTLTFDMGRCGVQSYVLYHLVNSNDYEYALGRTYFGAVSLVIPKAVWQDRPPNKRREGTELFFGRGSHVPHEFEITWIYGLAGETMLNFGPFAVPFAFIVLGAVTGFTRRLLYSVEAGDVRVLFLPFLVSICFITLAWDLDNVIVFTMKNGAFAATIVLLGTKVHVTSPAEPNTKSKVCRL